MATLKELKEIIDSTKIQAEVLTQILDGDMFNSCKAISENMLKAQILLDIINNDINKIANITRRKG